MPPTRHDSPRGATEAELIVVEQDVFWNIASTAVDQDLYTSTINLCPDHVDVLIVCGQTTNADAVAVGAALAATELRPKAAFTSSLLPTYDPTNATLARLWTGWTTLIAFSAKPATLPAATFHTVTQFKRDWARYFNVSVSSIGSLVLSYPSMFEIFKAALFTARSLSSEDLREAFLALSGTNSYAREVQLDPLTGVNDGSVTWISQLNRTAGSVIALNVSQLIYHYDWPWSLLQVGHALSMSQSSTNIIVGWVLVMLGCWVAQIILEQAVFVRRRGGWYQLWLGLVATSLGGAGVWCSQWTMSSALTLTKPTDGSPLPISFSFDVAILAVLPALLLTWCGLMVLMRDVENNSSEVAHAKHSAAHVARQINKEQRAEKRKRAALSNRAHFFHLKDSLSRNVLAGATLIAMAICVSRVTLWYNWSVQASIVSSAVGWIVSAAVSLLLVLPALLMYFHALKWRTAAVFMLSGAVMIDWQVHMYTITFKYAASVLVTPVALYNVLLSSTGVQLITGIIAALTCFGFIGLQFSRMQLSRNGLSVLVASLENVINNQKTALQHEQHQASYLRVQADELVRIVEAINIVRPIPKEYAWALANCSNASTFLQLHEHAKTAGHAMSAIAAASHSVANSVAHSNNRGLTRRQSNTPASAVEAYAMIAPARQNDKTLGWTDSQTRKAGVDSSRDPMADVNDDDQVDNRASIVSHSHRPSLRTSQAQSHGRALLAAQDTAAVEGQSVLKEDAANEPSVNSESVASLTAVGHSAQVDHHSQRKQMEADLVALLTEQAKHAANSAMEQVRANDGILSSVSTTSINGRGCGPSTEELEFTMVTATKSKPTLAELLSHPVCVELLKDELERIHSVENLVFYLHVVRYRQLDAARARRMVATLIFNTFIAENAEQQINISTRQRDAIQAQLKKRGDDVATPQLFCEAEREVAMLMETNVMKTFTATPSYRLCSLVLAAIDLDKATGKWGAAQQPKRASGDGWSDGMVSLLGSGSRGGQLPHAQDVETSVMMLSTKGSSL